MRCRLQWREREMVRALLQDTVEPAVNMAAAVVDGVSSMAKHMFDGLVNEYYGRKKGNVKPWTKAHLRRVIQFINGANLAYEIGHKRSNAEIYFSKCYEVLSVDGVQRVVTKRARDDGSVKIMLAKEEYFDILQAYHEKMGHVGYDKLCSVVRERFTLPRHVIGMFVSCCNVCKNCKVPAGIRTTRKRKASSVTSKGSSGKASPYLKNKEKTQNSISSFNRLPDSNFLNVEDSESSGDFDLRDLRGNFVASMQYSPRVPQAPPATQKQSAPPQQPPPSQKMVPPQQVSAPKQIAPKPTSTPVSPLQPLPPPPEVCLRWNSYHSNMQATFPSLLNNEQFVDVTLACEGRSIKCHKMMLSACSAYFEELLSQNPCQHPIVLMKDLKYWEVQALVDFMYRGEVNVAQDKLPSLLAAAEALQIKGLAGPAFSSHDDENTQSSAPLSSAEDYLDESTPSPSGSRRARKRRVMSSTQSPRTQAVQSPQVPVTPTRSTTGKRTVKPSLSMPSTSNYQHESSNLPSEPPARRARKSESGELEIKIEPIDIEISNDSMDQMDDSFMEKTFDDAEAGDGGESSGQGDDPGGTNESKPSISSDTRMNVHGQDGEQMDFGNNSGTSRNDQNFRYEDSGSQDGMSAVPELPGTSYQESLSQPSSSGINSSDNLLGRM